MSPAGVPGQRRSLGPGGPDRSCVTERRLAAIVAADVAGYSRLMHEDEEGTYARLSRIMSRAANPSIALHGGKLVKGTGDGFLAEFSSTVGAGRCALQFLRHAAERMAPEPPSHQLVFQMGIHLGEIIAEPSSHWPSRWRTRSPQSDRTGKHRSGARNLHDLRIDPGQLAAAACP